mmetsp:Transcript_25112/g.37015  ORF Transcript_25112/g.37015 Transcript_25112/m.37015 type:complete len:161 (-) Transcript_25112:104-586(-)|eukprot:CAMPEP_0185025788 /NCGR_PEP_ID=MMETSP1103-20130426/9304_1 /TAXON_ID=36769 /ORGANISM="Paraphysomonas bandaiensis, Strain Caron Lab Isolate" /LENGTH=160 /DNA_ID=CAMNT_0027559133 /DNA_START=60 /DNA_END=542 /DNA_ORIENTATION=-
MPRGGGSRSSRSAPSRAPPSRPVSSAPPPAKAAPPPPAPAPRPSPPPPAQQPSQGGGMLSGIGSTIMQGMAFGTGSAIAHRAVGAVAGSFGGGSSDQQQQQPAQQQAPSVPAVTESSSADGPCQVDLKAFNNCMKENNNNVSACDFYFQALQQCQSSSSY